MKYIKCSRASCDKEANYLIAWNNPKIHNTDYIKKWTSCKRHEQYLKSYLLIRGFYKFSQKIN